MYFNCFQEFVSFLEESPLGECPLEREITVLYLYYSLVLGVLLHVAPSSNYHYAMHTHVVHIWLTGTSPYGILS